MAIPLTTRGAIFKLFAILATQLRQFENKEDLELNNDDVAKTIAKAIKQVGAENLAVQQEILSELKQLNAKINAIVSLIIEAAAQEGVELQLDLEGKSVPRNEQQENSLDGR